MSTLLPGFKTYEGQPIRIVEVKEDGHSIQIERRPNKILVLTKNGKDIWTKLQRVEHLNVLIRALPPSTTILAELHVRGIQATSIPTLLNDADTRLDFTVFALPQYAGRDMTNADFNEVYSLVAGCGMCPPTIKYLWNSSVSLSEDMQKELLAKARSKGLEGWVCKEHHMTGWYKLKPVKTVDAFVIGTEISHSASFYGGMQSICIAVWDDKHIVDLGTVGSGFEADYRMMVDRKSLLHKVAEIKYDSLAANGKLKFPRFLRWRDDKDWKQCKRDQL